MDEELRLFQAVTSNAVSAESEEFQSALRAVEPEHTTLNILSAAVRSGDMQKISALLNHGFPVNYQKKERLAPTPLLVAIYERNVDAVRLLLERGADTEIPVWGTPLTPLIVAIQNNSVEIVRLLLGAGANANHVMTDVLYEADTPLLQAIQYENVEIVQALLEHGANPEQPSRSGTTPLEYAALRRQDADIVSLLLRHGVPVSDDLLNAVIMMPGLHATDVRTVLMADPSSAERLLFPKTTTGGRTRKTKKQKHKQTHKQKHKQQQKQRRRQTKSR